MADKYATLSPESRAQLIKMDNDAQTFKEKLRADIQTGGDIKPGIMFILKMAKLWTPTIGHKRIGQVLADLAKELL